VEEEKGKDKFPVKDMKLIYAGNLKLIDFIINIYRELNTVCLKNRENGKIPCKIL
jgi:hypothetical protein